MRIHIHGRGSISSAGANPAAAWEAYVSGRPTWREDPSSRLPVYPVTDDPGVAVREFAANRSLDRAGTLALIAAEQAVMEADWKNRDFAILVGCSRGPTGAWEKHFRAFSETGRTEPRSSPSTTLGSIGFALGEFFGNTALSSSLSVTCSSGMHAMLHGIALLESGMAHRVLVGGAEAPLTPFTLQQMQALRIYAERPRRPEHACRPLSSTPSGMVVGEGAAFLALSKSPRHPPAGASTTSSKQPSAPDYPHIHGLGFSREVGRTATGISPEGDGLLAAMRMAVTDQKLPDFVVAHAPGTPKGDAAEGRAIAKLCPGTHVTSFKWATGHTFGASGPLAVDAAISSLRHRSFLSPPYSDTKDGPEQPQTALVNATGFGGNAVSIFLDASDSKNIG